MEDLVGLPWAEAEPLARARGLAYRTVVTVPPGRPAGTGPLRVVGVRPQEGLMVPAPELQPAQGGAAG